MKAAATFFTLYILFLPYAVHAAETSVFPFPTYSETSGVATKHIFLGDTLVATVTGTGASSSIQYVHRDLLGSTNVVTEKTGKPAEFIGYTSYGAPRVDQQVSGSRESRTYINEYADPSTSLSYLNARYYDGARGQFVSEDPLFWADPSKQNLSNPQTLNSYTYASDNPITAKDPTGLLTVIIPGTFYKPGDWSAGGSEAHFIKSVGNTFHDSAHTQVINDPSIWSGADSTRAREKAANGIASIINSYQFADGEPLNLVGHSHGGNIAISVTQKISHPVTNLVTLGTPVRSEYQPNYKVVQNHVSAFSTHEPVQNLFGGGLTSVSQVIGTALFGFEGFLLGGLVHLGELGPAGRTFVGATNLDVSSDTGWGIAAHSRLITNPAVWDTVSQYTYR